MERTRGVRKRRVSSNKFRSMKEYKLLIAIQIIWVLFFVATLVEKRSCNQNKDMTTTVQIVRDTSHVSDIELKHYLKEINMKFPNIVYAQAVLESGHFKSDLCRDNNNIFGMKVSYNRPTTAVYQKNGYCVYKTWKESVLDYALYQSYYFSKIVEEEDYLLSLQNYAVDTTYLQKLKLISNTYEMP